MSTPHITFSQVTKEFYLQGEKTMKELIPSLIKGKSWAKKLTALHDLSFTISAGETVGIVGRNGAGKSTLMKLIAGVTYPTTGSVTSYGRVAPMIELGAGFHYELNGYENIFLNGAILGMHKKEIELVLEDIIDFSGVKEFLHEPLKRFSTGMVMRLAFAIVVHAKAQIYLIDEVLAVGDAAFKEKCLNKLEQIKKQKDTIIIFVSHDEEAVTQFCDRALLLEKGSCVADGTPKSIFKEYNSRLSEVA